MLSGPRLPGCGLWPRLARQHMQVSHLLCPLASPGGTAASIQTWLMRDTKDTAALTTVSDELHLHEADGGAISTLRRDWAHDEVWIDCHLQTGR